MNMIKPTNFTRVKSDINGNSRFVCHFLQLNTREELADAIALSQKYVLALKRARALGGKKFHNKQFGGGIVFQEYAGCLPRLCDKINQLLEEEVTA
jgi:hypothetical protein